MFQLYRSSKEQAPIPNIQLSNLKNIWSFLHLHLSFTEQKTHQSEIHPLTMADPVSIAITATLLPIVLAGIQSGLALALDAMPEIHDQRNKHAMKKLHALFLKAKKGELTEKGKTPS